MEHKLAIGTMLNVSTGCEPFFALSYNRRTVSMSGETYKVDIKAVEDYRKVTDNQGELPDCFVTAQDINWKERVDMQAALQEFCDTAISSTVNLRKETTVDDVKQLYIYAWKKGLKGITIFRDGSRDPILSVENKDQQVSDKLSDNTENAKEIINVKELKRGDVIKASDSWIGIKRKLITGCGSLHVCAYFDPNNGELRECYLSKGSTGGCQHYMIGLSRMISLAARGGIGLEAILDQLKSCGVCSSYAVRSAVNKDTSKGSCCPMAVGNALRDMYKEMQNIICECNNGKGEKLTKYRTPELYVLDSNETVPEGFIAVDDIPKKNGQSTADAVKEYVQNVHNENSLEECPNCHEKTLIHQGGCVECSSCGFSRCS